MLPLLQPVFTAMTAHPGPGALSLPKVILHIPPKIGWKKAQPGPHIAVATAAQQGLSPGGAPAHDTGRPQAGTTQPHQPRAPMWCGG